MRPHGYSIGPFRLEVDFRRYRKALMGLRAAIRCRGSPIDAEEMPKGWERRRREWPRSLIHPVGYWLSIWKRDSATGAHITIKPRPIGWLVQYNPENSWNGGPTVDRGLTFAEAINVATETAESLNQGASKYDLRRTDVD